MPLIPPTLFRPDSDVAHGPTQCGTFNMSLLSAGPIPEIPSFPSGDSVIDFFRTLGQAIVCFVAQAPGIVSQFAEDHPEEVKIGEIVVLVVLALVALWIALPGPAVPSVLTAVCTSICSLVNAAVTGIIDTLDAMEQLLLWLAGGVLSLVGFTPVDAEDVASGSIAAGVQSVVYGPFTTGVFAALQSLGVTIGQGARGVSFA